MTVAPGPMSTIVPVPGAPNSHYYTYRYAISLYPWTTWGPPKISGATPGTIEGRDEIFAKCDTPPETCPAGQQWDANTQACVPIPCPPGTTRSPTIPSLCIPIDNAPDPCKKNPASCAPKPEQYPPPEPMGGGGGGSCKKPKQPPITTPKAGNPIAPFTGVKTEPVPTGVQIGGVALTLTYDSTSRVPGSVSSLFDQLPSFGGIWFSSLHRKLTVSANRKTALLARGDGRILGLTGDGTGTFTTSANLGGRLVSINGGYRYLDDSSMAQEIYSDSGLLTGLTTVSGKQLTFAYDTDDNLITVQDDTGRVIRFEYAAVIIGSPLQLVSRIVDATGQAIVASYDGTTGNLSSLTWQDGMTRQFLYENTNFPWALTGVADESTSRYSYFNYDSEGRAISTEHAGGANRFSVTYTQPPSMKVVDSIDGGSGVLLSRTRSWELPSGVVLTTPNGTTSEMSLQSQRGVPSLTGMSQPAGSGCTAATSAMAYDSNGNVANYDDFSGKRSCYAYDLTNNLANLVVEGLDNTVDCSSVLSANATLPVGSRKFSTQFHPDWGLSTRTAQPLSIDTNVYNGQPDPTNGNAIASCAPAGAQTPDGKPIAVLCKQVVQATLDANGRLGLGAALDTGVAPRVTSYTYDAAGRTLTSTNSFNDTTTYTYYATTAFTGTGASAVGFTMGDLQSITGPTGQVTSFNAYDKAGRVLQMTDANGIVTNKTYTPRGWVNTVSVTPPGGTARTTTYTYDNVGQVIGVNNPNGTTLSFAYDAAHRLYQATDARGNSVSYGLDPSGNRVMEQLKDSSGTLLRDIRRTFDDLNHMQQMQLQDITPSNT